MRNKKSLLLASLLAPLIAVTNNTNAETIHIGIGHQSMVTNTVAGGIVLEKLGLIEKYLPKKEGKYKDAEFRIEFRDYDSGPPITNQMLANKLEFGVMGDYPLIVNGAKFQETGKQESRLIAVTGYNLKGTGNGIVVPMASPYQSLTELAGKSLSVPLGSAAWGMTLKALNDAGLTGKVTLVNQAPPIGAANIAAGKIDAHADFCPWSEIMAFRGTGRKIYDGSEANIPTFHGIVVREKFAQQYPELVDAVLRATLEAQAWIKNDPVRAATEISKWTGVEKEVLYLYFSEGGITTVEASIKPQWIAALKNDHALLQKEIGIPNLDFARWIDDSYLKKAYAESSLDYTTMVSKVVSPIPQNPALKPAEIWYGDGGVVKYDRAADMIAAIEKAKAQHTPINASYVYDAISGVKLFGKSAYFVKNEAGEVLAFMKKIDSEKSVAKQSGTQLLPNTVLAKLP